jgi:hypothetical protein
VDTEIFLLEPRIANPQILWIIPLLQIRKFLRIARQQIANPQIFMINLQITNVCQSANGKSANFFTMEQNDDPFSPFLALQILIRAMWICGSFKSAKKIGSANRKSANCHIC